MVIAAVYYPHRRDDHESAPLLAQNTKTLERRRFEMAMLIIAGGVQACESKSKTYSLDGERERERDIAGVFSAKGKEVPPNHTWWISI